MGTGTSTSLQFLFSVGTETSTSFVHSFLSISTSVALGRDEPKPNPLLSIVPQSIRLHESQTQLQLHSASMRVVLATCNHQKFLPKLKRIKRPCQNSQSLCTQQSQQNSFYLFFAMLDRTDMCNLYLAHNLCHSTLLQGKASPISLALPKVYTCSKPKVCTMFLTLLNSMHKTIYQLLERPYSENELCTILPY